MLTLSDLVSRVLRVAPILLAIPVVVQTSRAASWSAINAGVPAATAKVDAIVISPSNPRTLYTYSRSSDSTGGMFKSKDGAQSWNAISSGTAVNFLVADPRDPDTVYILTDRGLMKSTNGGASWAGAGTGLAANVVGLVIDPITPANLYAVTAAPAGVYKSTNGGGRWESLNTGVSANTFINSLAIDSISPSTLYAAAFVPSTGGVSSAVILKTTDGGESWNIRDSGLPANSVIRFLVIAPTDSSVIYADGGELRDAAIVKSVDGGESWNRVATGLSSEASVLSVIIDPQDSSTVYIVTAFPFPEGIRILKTIDGGLSWNVINTPPLSNGSLAIDPLSSSTMYLPVDGSIFKSTDGSTTWSRVSTLSTIDVQTLAVNGLEAATVYAGVGNSILKSTDTGTSWTTLSSFHIRASSGEMFIPSPFPDGAPANVRSLMVDLLNPDVLYAGTYRKTGCYYGDRLLFKTTDGGVSWSESVSPENSGCVLSGALGRSSGLKTMDPNNPTTLYVAQANDEDGGYWLLKTQDGGISWNPTQSYPGTMNAGMWALAVDPSDSATLYAGLDDVPWYSGRGGVFKSTDGGASWNKSGLEGSAVKLILIDPVDTNILYASTEGKYVEPTAFRSLVKSTDRGATWEPINHGLGALFDRGCSMTALVIHPVHSNLLYAGTSCAGVFKSSNGGANWSQFNDGLPNLNVRTLILGPKTSRIVYAATDAGLFRSLDE